MRTSPALIGVLRKKRDASGATRRKQDQKDEEITGGRIGRTPSKRAEPSDMRDRVGRIQKEVD